MTILDLSKVDTGHFFTAETATFHKSMYHYLTVCFFFQRPAIAHPETTPQINVLINIHEVITAVAGGFSPNIIAVYRHLKTEARRI